MKKLLLAISLICPVSLPVAAMEEEASKARLDVYFIPQSTLNITIVGFGSVSDDGDGMGIKGEVAVENLLLTGEYQQSNYELSDFDIGYLRLGIGAQTPGTVRFGGLLELVNQDFDGAEASGIGFHGRLSWTISKQVELKLQAGMLSLTDPADVTYKGPEILAGLSIMATPNVGFFADYRSNELDNSDVKIGTDDVRAGVRIAF